MDGARAVLTLCLLLVTSTAVRSAGAARSDTAQAKTPESGTWSCDDDDLNTSAMKSLHEKLDDDHDGEVEVDETSEFVQNEMSAGEPSGRYKKFHANDSNISLSEMITRWTDINPAYNWTTAELVYWLNEAARMPEYSSVFEKYKISGKCLPRIALNKEKFLQGTLGITRRRDRNKLKLKAMEVVLFGPVFPSHFWYNVMMSVAAFVVMVLSVYVMRERHQNVQMRKMLEESHNRLIEAQTIRDTLKTEQDVPDSDTAVSVVSDQQEYAVQDDVSVHTENMESEIVALRQHIVHLKRELESKGTGVVPADLLKLLCHTYDKETQYFEATRDNAEKSLKESEEQYLKFSKKVRNSIIPSSIKFGGGRSLAELDQCISDAKTRLGAVWNDRQERQQRWSKIEKHCRFRITDAIAVRKLMQVKGFSTRSDTRFTRKSPRAATYGGHSFSGAADDHPAGISRSITVPDKLSGSSQPGAPTLLTSFNASLRGPSPSKPVLSVSSSAHSLKRMTEVDEGSDTSPSRQRHTPATATPTSSKDSVTRRQSDETVTSSTSRQKLKANTSFPILPSSSPHIRKRTADRQQSDPGNSSSGRSRVPAVFPIETTRRDQVPESEV